MTELSGACWERIGIDKQVIDLSVGCWEMPGIDKQMTFKWRMLEKA